MKTRNETIYNKDNKEKLPRIIQSFIDFSLTIPTFA